MKFLEYLSRVVVGNLFIFSGIVKANDPLGFSYKLEEYFVEFGMDWSWIHDILVPLASALCIIEIVLGVAVLVGYRMKMVSWSLLLMIIFFTILTGASAIFEIVRSCGCFGDAIPLTPWQSFYKDLILMFFIGILFYRKNHIQPFGETKQLVVMFAISTLIIAALANLLEWDMVGLVLATIWLAVAVLQFTKNKESAATVAVVISLLYSIYVCVAAIEYLPFKDFRPYAIGKNLPEQMTLPPDAKPPVYENILTYKNNSTGEVRDFTTAEYTASKIWEDKNWEWQNTESKLIEEGDEAKITDLSILSHNDEDLTDIILNENKVMWIVSYDLSKAETKHFNEINALVAKAKSDGYKVYGLSSAGTDQKNDFIEKYDLAFDFMIVDGIVLKTMVRSNPGIMFLERGTVTEKYHVNDVEGLVQNL